MEIALLKWTTLIICPIIISINAVPSPGLLKVPKVYNALITSDQNLEPSRAYPVIQPVVHRTSVGYVPPFYYTQVGPGFLGPQILPGPGPIPNGPGQVLPTTQPSAKENPDVEQVEINEKNPNDRDSSSEKELADDEETKNDGKNKERVPVNFYPNYQSPYYNPYFYGYNPYPQIPPPGPYYFDYQPHGPLIPFPPGLPPPGPAVYPTAQPNPDSVTTVASNGSSSSRSSAQREKKKKIKVNSPVM
ncbi:hypothetical protein PV325_007093 [Microctonus aethiopoides]|uniref:Uncharacterized protein n=1 Tax=Microctonus aethiopoides TaxID=144406 RepID=A0AA39FJ16_9HYME|nr:hypothetical protein PV325_007093 [Microctonus aethiopoides]KAK0170346.1 hypothetical protein PV328_010919 [Microctonus aethiopoides]